MAEKCRLCLNVIETLASTATIDDICFHEKLNTLFTFQITTVETFPSAVCLECEEKVEQFHSYHEQVKHNQDRLWAIQKEECFEQVKVEPNIEVDFSSFELPFEEKGSTETTDDKLNEVPVKLEEPCDNDTDTTDFEVIPDESAEETETKSDKPQQNQRMRRKKLHQHVRSGKIERKRSIGKAIDEKKPVRKKFCATDETNRRLREFYDMKCEICGQQQDSFTTLKIHYHQQHNTRGYIKCCGRMFNSRYRLLEHLSYHVGASMVRCEICDKTFSSRTYLQVHNSRVHGRAEDRPFKCTQCHQSYAMECHLKAHMVSHVRVSCSICGKELSSSFSLRTHMINMHGNRENLICDSCGKEFRTRQAFDRHVKLHMGVDVTEQLQCSLCSKWLTSKRALKVHIKHVHTEAGQTFKCDLCTQECPNSRALSNHKLRVHVEERFECEVCGKRFKRQLYLKEHIALHTGKPLYSCDICGATFNSNANKYSHRKNKHPVEWEARRKQQQMQTESI
ncbi:zinc finger protein OZF-like [Anopheles ziemanni]|uniref:zinc finger protein OZF-like n=1 Tax=Anopheles coustani TaxID=139045 RepID=UPI002659BF1D|nr:zinc finger protein OZF-like [Anopheles coustani]XP_058178051.1 zinc finger protein OZF-like [Anopheles ziemanni]